MPGASKESQEKRAAMNQFRRIATGVAISMSIFLGFGPSQLIPDSSKMGKVMVHRASALDISPLLASSHAFNSAAQLSDCTGNACGLWPGDLDREQEENEPVPAP